MGLFRRKQKRYLDGHAEIVETWRPRQDGSMGNCKMKLRLDVPGVAPQVVGHHELFMVPNRWPEVGMRVAVTVEADDPTEVDVHWDSVFGEVYGGLAGRAAEMVALAGGVDVDLSKGPDDANRGGEPDPDYQEKIAALNAAYARGDITYEVMTAAIQRVLGAA